MPHCITHEQKVSLQFGSLTACTVWCVSLFGTATLKCSHWTWSDIFNWNTTSFSCFWYCCSSELIWLHFEWHVSCGQYSPALWAADFLKAPRGSQMCQWWRPRRLCRWRRPELVVAMSQCDNPQQEVCCSYHVWSPVEQKTSRLGWAMNLHKHAWAPFHHLGFVALDFLRERAAGLFGQEAPNLKDNKFTETEAGNWILQFTVRKARSSNVFAVRKPLSADAVSWVTGHSSHRVGDAGASGGLW